MTRVCDIQTSCTFTTLVLSTGPSWSSVDTRRCKKITRTQSDFSGFEPTSPKVGCLGQVKNGKKPPSDFFSGKQSNNKFSKLRRIVSGRLCGATSGGKKRFDRSDSSAVVSFEMDPPLPVLKPAYKASGVESLWKRRCGESLMNLDLNKACVSPAGLELLRKS